MYIKNKDAYHTKMINSKKNISDEVAPPPPTDYLLII